jgi:hypothetical protein
MSRDYDEPEDWEGWEREQERRAYFKGIEKKNARKTILEERQRRQMIEKGKQDEALKPYIRRVKLRYAYYLREIGMDKLLIEKIMLDLLLSPTFVNRLRSMALKEKQDEEVRLAETPLTPGSIRVIHPSEKKKK